MIRKNRKYPALLLIPFAVLMGFYAWVIPLSAMDSTGPRVLMDEGFTIGLLAFVILLALSSGAKVLSWLQINHGTYLDRFIYQVGLGLGIIAYGILVLGLVKLLVPWTVFAWLLLIGFWTRKELNEFLSWLPAWFGHLMKSLFQVWRALPWWEKLVWVFMAGILILGSALALTPPWSYDALMYHLQGAKVFFEAGRINIIPDMFQANGPFTIELLFIIGLVFKTDLFAKLIHFSFAILYILITYSIGKRYLGAQGGRYAIYILLGSPILVYIASWAQVDFAWGFYEILAFYSFLLWREKYESGWLVLAGIMGGIASGIKFISIGGVGLLALFISFTSLRHPFRVIFRNLALFGGIVLLVASPWYLKNLLWAGNPLYPMYIGGLGWPMSRVEILAAHLQTYGSGVGLWSLIALPWNLIQNPGLFSDGILVTLPLLSPLAFLFPIFRRPTNLTLLAVWSFTRFGVWAFSYQVMRHLFSLFPLMSIMAAGILIYILNTFRSKKLFQFIFGILFLISSGLPFYVSLSGSLMYRTIPTVLGQISRNEFLRLNVSNYKTIEYIKENLPANARVFMMWDGRGYYCDERCLYSADQSKWSWLVATHPDPQSLTEQLRAWGTTHLLFSLNDANYYIGHDASGKQKQAYDFFKNTYRVKCARLIYQDKPSEFENFSLYELTCK